MKEKRLLKISDVIIEKISDSIVDSILMKGSDKESLKRRQNRLSEPLELAFRKGIVVLFKEQRDLVIAVLQGKEKSLKGTKENINKAIAIPASKGETEKFAKYVLPKITEAVMIAGNDALAVLDVGVAFDVLNPRVVDWLKEHAAEAVKSIGETTKKALKKTLTEGVENGESIAKLMKRVQAEYKDLELEAWRAKRIALYETKTATNRGNFEGILQSGLKGKKGILLGPRPCDICLDFEAIGEIDLNDTWGGFDCPTFHIGCYSKDTEIYTKGGWKYIKDTEMNESILTLIPESKQLEWNKIINKISYKQNKIVHLTNKQTSFDMLVSKNHPYFGYKRIDRGTKGRILEPIWYNDINEISPLFAFYTSSEWVGKEKKIININGEILKTEDYCKLMGYYLSEGYAVKRGENWYQISISQDREKNYDNYMKIYEDLKSLNIKLYPCKGGILFNNVNIGKYLIKFGKSYEKYIPEEIKELTAKYIKIFLDAFLLGDGTIQKGKKWKGFKFKDKRIYYTSSKKMADDLGELIIKIGKSVSYELRRTKGKEAKFKNGNYILNHNSWIINELTSKFKNFCNIKSEIIDYNDSVYDVEVKNHTILTRRSGKVIWGSNCQCDIYFVPD